MNIQKQVYDYVVKRFLGGEADSDFNYDTKLLEDGVIDSSGVLELIMFIEDTFNIEFSEDELIPENFLSLNIIADYLTREKANA